MTKEELEKELEKELKNKCVDTSCPVLSINNQNMRRIAELEKENVELKKQMVKMRCCYNCKQSQDEGYCKIKKSDVNDLSCWDCGCNEWEIKK